MINLHGAKFDKPPVSAPHAYNSYEKVLFRKNVNSTTRLSPLRRLAQVRRHDSDIHQKGCDFVDKRMAHSQAATPLNAHQSALPIKLPRIVGGRNSQWAMMSSCTRKLAWKGPSSVQRSSVSRPCTSSLSSRLIAWSDQCDPRLRARVFHVLRVHPGNKTFGLAAGKNMHPRVNGTCAARPDVLRPLLSNHNENYHLSVN